MAKIPYKQQWRVYDHCGKKLSQGTQTEVAQQFGMKLASIYNATYFDKSLDAKVFISEEKWSEICQSSNHDFALRAFCRSKDRRWVYSDNGKPVICDKKKHGGKNVIRSRKALMTYSQSQMEKAEEVYKLFGSIENK